MKKLLLTLVIVCAFVWANAQTYSVSASNGTYQYQNAIQSSPFFYSLHASVYFSLPAKPCPNPPCYFSEGASAMAIVEGVPQCNVSGDAYNLTPPCNLSGSISSTGSKYIYVQATSGWQSSSAASVTISY